MNATRFMRYTLPLLFVVGLSGAACAQQSAVFCGKILWPSHRQDYLPLPEGMEVTCSTEAAIAKAIRKSGPQLVQFTYEDSFVAYRLLQDVVTMIIAEGRNHACLRAALLDTAGQGNPTEVSPLADTAPMVFDGGACRPDWGCKPEPQKIPSI